MRQENIRNIAIIAHVDHGKTTLVDQMLRATDAFRENQQVQERVLDSNDQERERGITILAKNISIEYQGVKINVIDTPGHADFGGEVERVLRMADGALLLVDAAEGPMPQTRFVLRHAIDAGLAIMIVVNKIDREGARPEAVVNDSLDLMADLGATDEQLEFAMEHVIYASAVNGFARLDPADDNQDMFPMLDMIVSDLPAPEVDVDGPLAMQCVTIDHSEYVGRIGIGRIYSGTIHAGDKILVVKNDGSRAMSQVKQLFTFDYLGRKECSEAQAGDIAAVVGIDSTDIGDVYTDPDNPVELEPIEIDPPTLSVVFEPSTSPLVGREGDIVGGRQLKERLMQERENNVTMRIEEQRDHAHRGAPRQDRRRGGRPRHPAPLRPHGDHAPRGLRVPGGPPARALQEGRQRRHDRARGAGRRGVPRRVLRQGHRGLWQRGWHHDEYGRRHHADPP